MRVLRGFQVTRFRLVGCVLLPFAAGYYLSYLFRTINALIATDLTAELGLGAADLGLLTSVYFLVFAAAQLPFGVLLDRHGPRTIQSALLLLASVGALVFALADSLAGLVLGRALIGLGVALALMAGFKAIVLWFPAERLALVNGWFVMLGALGAVTATAPAEVIVQAVGWRGLFAVLGSLSAVAALLILVIVPECQLPPTPKTRRPISLWIIYRDRRFWRLAPLSAVGVGTSWSLQGLWAASWLRDVDGFDRAGIVQLLSIMAVAVSASGLVLGLAADRLRRFGVKIEDVLAIAAAGAATVLSYAILAEYFPKQASGRANAALNIMHVGMAFVLQYVTGLVIEQWPVANDHYPASAHQCAMSLTLVLQVASVAWFGLASRRRRSTPALQSLVEQVSAHGAARPAHDLIRFGVPVATRNSAGAWRAATAASALVCIVLMACLLWASGQASIAAHVTEVAR